MKKLKLSLIAFTKFSLLCLAFFVLSTPIHAQAMFSDTAIVNMGIKLELGTVDLAATDIKTIGSVNYSGGEPITIASKKLLNDGSLSAKLAYKFVIKKADGTVLSNEELSGVSVFLNFGEKAKEVSANVTALKTNSFTFVKDANNKDIIIDPDETEGIPVAVNYKSNAPTKAEKLTVEVTFRLIQSNATDANAKLFSNEKEVSNTLMLVPKVVEEESYWPEESTFKKSNQGKMTYSLVKMKMLYSESYDTLNSRVKQIKNLNKAVLYIEFPNNVPVAKLVKKADGTEEIKPAFVFDGLSTNNDAIVIESKEINKEKNGIIITFKLNDSYDSTTKPRANNYALNLGIRIRRNGESGDYDGIYETIPDFAKQLVLSSDIPVGTDGGNFEHRIIPLSTVKKSIVIKQLNGTSHWVNKNEFHDVLLTEEIIELEVKGEDSKLMNYSLISKNEFSLRLDPGENSNEATLNVKITGDTKNTLVISRKLELQNYLMEIKSAKISSTTEDMQQTNSEEKIEESSSMIDNTLSNDQFIEEPINGDDQEKVKEVIDSSSAESSAGVKEENTVPIESSNQSIPEEKISDE